MHQASVTKIKGPPSCGPKHSPSQHNRLHHTADVAGKLYSCMKMSICLGGGGGGGGHYCCTLCLPKPGVFSVCLCGTDELCCKLHHCLTEAARCTVQQVALDVLQPPRAPGAMLCCGCIYAQNGLQQLLNWESEKTAPIVFITWSQSHCLG